MNKITLHNRLMRALAVLLGHGFAAVVALSSFWLLARYAEYLGIGAGRLFQTVTLDDLLAAADLSIFVLFLVFGTLEAVKAFCSND